jgi:hypothetical protein
MTARSNPGMPAEDREMIALDPNAAWLAGDRRAALTEFAELELIERGSPS